MTRPSIRFLPLAALLLLALAGPVLAGPLPASPGAPKVGEKAPDFTLPDTNGNPVTLSDLRSAADGRAGSWVLLVFYRGYW